VLPNQVIRFQGGPFADSFGNGFRLLPAAIDNAWLNLYSFPEVFPCPFLGSLSPEYIPLRDVFPDLGHRLQIFLLMFNEVQRHGFDIPGKRGYYIISGKPGALVRQPGW